MGDQPIGMFQTSSLSIMLVRLRFLQVSVLLNKFKSEDSAIIMVYAALILLLPFMFMKNSTLCSLSSIFLPFYIGLMSGTFC